MPPYLAFGGWLDLAYEISGVWALGPKLQFHTQAFCFVSRQFDPHFQPVILFFFFSFTISVKKLI
jgi:hypothetical protein